MNPFKAILFIFFLICFVSPVFATTYYVNISTGNDSNPGTIGSPFQHISRCDSTSAPRLTSGDTCEVQAGAYDARTTLSNNAGVIYDGSSQAARTMGITIAVNNVTIQNFEFSNCNDSSHTPGTTCTTAMSSSDSLENIHFNTNATGAIIQNNNFHDTQVAAIRLNDSTSSIQILNNTASYIGETSEVITALGTNITNDVVTITANVNDKVSWKSQGTTFTVTLTPGTYMNGCLGGGLGVSSCFGFPMTMTNTQINCGAAGNCTLSSTVQGPTSAFQLLYIANNAYDAFGWTTAAGSQCGANVAGSFPCAGVLEGHGQFILGSNGGGTSATGILVSGNTASHFSEFSQVGNFDSKWVIVNNTMGPLGAFSWDHHDGVESGGNNTKFLIEGNYGVNTHNPDNRIPLGLFEEATDLQIIARYNYTYLGAGTNGWIYGGRGYIYNNDIGVNATGYINIGEQQINSEGGTNKSANNIWHNACCGNSALDPYNNSTAGGMFVFNDLYFQTAAPCSINGCTASGLVHGDPQFNSVSTGDYHLTSSSPARNAGAALTTTNGTGTGSTSLTVNDPYWFQDGWAGANSAGIGPDCIAIGTISNFACIVSGTINYSTGAMTLSAGLTWSNGASVWLYSKADGVHVLTDTTGPDIGAFPYNASCTPDHLAFTTQPTNVNVGAALAVQVSVEDSGNNVCSGDTSTITIANKAATCTGMTLSGTTSGSNIFNTANLSENASGACTLHATDGALTAADSNAFTVSGVVPTVSVQPQSQTIPGGSTASLSVTASGTAPLTYQWYQGGSCTGSTVGTNSSAYTTAALTVMTTYSVNISNTYGNVCSTNAVISISTGIGGRAPILLRRHH